MEVSGLTNSQSPTTAITVANNTRLSIRISISGTKITYNAVRKAELDALV
jgi:hypothetical protein